jgi:hypothetical protein
MTFMYFVCFLARQNPFRIFPLPEMASSPSPFTSSLAEIIDDGSNLDPDLATTMTRGAILHFVEHKCTFL